MNIYQRIWNAYAIFKAGQSHVIRTGYSYYGVYRMPKDGQNDFYRRESDLEHVAGFMWLVQQINLFRPDLVSDEDLKMMSLVASLHEIGEVFEGDTPDDGRRNDDDKNTKELMHVVAYCELLPEEAKMEALQIFTEFQEKSTPRGRLLYMCDKADGTLQTLLYRMEGREGSPEVKRKLYSRLSVQDCRAIDLTESSEMSDIWALSFAEKCRDYEGFEFFWNLLLIASMEVRGHGFGWARKIGLSDVATA